ncbi:uncharacterized protein LAESUDRAFT_328376 [Laetiporus sulphureus 93-53]|uniref:Uncharacterized protein n=1 Tax=Laetiporus sulphureus 93-53 TaxID=1314785 RepID=A0A165CWV2_9APHY|nr:uncharacterized protein LAESUDRAFT_328376 [Laetiporus sulphureus 93-53]KZT03616.1 hypothetical protein LAESUDRAFT_328376 [Laetiporus sulphureus 93-53]
MCHRSSRLDGTSGLWQMQDHSTSDKRSAVKNARCTCAILFVAAASMFLHQLSPWITADSGHSVKIVQTRIYDAPVTNSSRLKTRSLVCTVPASSPDVQRRSCVVVLQDTQPSDVGSMTCVSAYQQQLESG